MYFTVAFLVCILKCSLVISLPTGAALQSNGSSVNSTATILPVNLTVPAVVAPPKLNPSSKIENDTHSNDTTTTLAPPVTNTTEESTTPATHTTPPPSSVTTANSSVTTLTPSSNSSIPTSSPTTTVKPTAPPGSSTAAPHKDRNFDGPSFIGGIVLAAGLMAISFVAFKFYRARTERNYHTL